MFGKALVFVLLVATLVICQTVSSTPKPPKKVLIFFSEPAYMPSTTMLDQSIRLTLNNGSSDRIQFYYDALDNFRIPNERYENELVGLLRRKYEGEQVNLVIPVGVPAIKFWLNHKDQLFPEIPVVFFSLDGNRTPAFDLKLNVTGVAGKLEFGRTLGIALTLHPDTKRVVVVAGSGSLDKVVLAQAQKEFQQYESRVEFTYLTDLTVQDFRRDLSSLPPKTIVFYLSILQDSSGVNYSNPESFSLVAPSSNMPVYGITQLNLGYGLVGGQVLNFDAFGKRVGEFALRVLAGERPQDIPQETVASTPMFDWRELRRWGIDENKLPAGSIVSFKQPTFWQLYKWRIVGAVSLIILQTLLIIGLLINRAKRRKAEEESKAIEARYRTVVETQTELICRYQPDTSLTFVNDAYCRYFDRTREQLIGTRFTELLPEHAREAALTHIASLIANPRDETYELEVVLSNGETGWQEWVDHVVEPAHGHGVELQGIGRDITERRRAAEELRLSEMRFRDMADSSAILIWLADADMLCTYFNQRILDFTGRTMDQLLGEGWLEVVHQDDVQRCVRAYTAGYEKREPFVLEYRLRRADGEYRWLYDTGAPRFGSNGDLLGYIGSAVDITDRRAAEEALQSAHEEVSKLKNQLEAENVYLQEEIKLAHNVDEIIGDSQAIKYVLYKIEQVSQTDTTTLILGETGTGKELVARAIHNQSKRKDRPLVKVNCAALSPSLIESELFGHEKGAFTGASARKIGRFELADGATLFLDEIGELPLELQAKLLRVLQEGEFERLGGTKTIKVDVRILAATNRNLKDEVTKGTFREDLWYRLNVFPVTVPALRLRKEDVPLMVEHFVRGYSRKVGKPITSISSATLKKLKDYSWPGNVRELANVIERAVVNSQGPILHIADQFEQTGPEKDSDLSRTLEEIEREYIVRVLEKTGWRIGGANGAALVLGLNSSTLRTRMLKLGIQKNVMTADLSASRR